MRLHAVRGMAPLSAPSSAAPGARARGFGGSHATTVGTMNSEISEIYYRLVPRFYLLVLRRMFSTRSSYYHGVVLFIDLVVFGCSHFSP